MTAEASYPKRWSQVFRNEAEVWLRFKRQLEHPDRKWLYENIEEPVLDIGCGNCIDASVFKDYVGLDITLEFLKAARFNYGVKNLIIGDGRHLPIRSGCLKTTYAKDVLHHYPFKEALKFLKEMTRTSDKVYVAWGRRKGTSYMPSDESEEGMYGGFHYNRFSIKEMRKHYKVEIVGRETTITKIEPLAD